MITTAATDQAAAQTLALAGQMLGRGDPGGAELALTPLFTRGLGQAAPVLQMMGAIRLAQGRPGEAAGLLARARAADPRHVDYAFNHGVALSQAGKTEDAIAAWRAAIKLQPDLAQAYLDIAGAQQRLGRADEAESTLRKLLRLVPGQVQARLALSGLLLDSDRLDEAQALLDRSLRDAAEPKARAAFHNNLAMLERRQNRAAEALAHFDQALALDPTLPYLDVQRAEVLQDLGRSEEAVALFRKVLAREPGNPHWHHYYNDLLYRLGRSEDFLKSYDTAPRTRELLMGKAYFLSHAKRGEDAHAVYAQMLARDPHDPLGLAGVANALVLMKRYGDAGPAFERALARNPDPELFSNAAEAAILRDDPQQAVALCEQGLRRDPYHQICLAAMSVAYRMMADARDETLNGYDSLIRSFELEPPEGFSRMEDFNAELDGWLGGLHSGSREYINQSLRGGTQTVSDLFGGGHDLVRRLRARIDETVGRYIAEMKDDAAHPFLSRRGKDFRYHGSWSSRLKDCGFHINHIHPAGWISSCYYVGVPEAAKDEHARQGWIKFGEPVFDFQLKNPIRRTIQPVPGRLVLFPSYMWHGTIPFHDAAPRTTIAFDVVPG